MNERRDPRAARRAALALLIGLLLSSVEARAGEPGRIAIEPQATIRGGTVRFRDLGSFDGSAARFGDLEVGAAPEPGETLRLSGYALLGQLRDAGLDESATLYTIPSAVRVARAFQEVSEVELRLAVERKLRDVLAEGESLEAVELPRSVRVPVGPFEVRVEEPAPAGAGARRRRVEAKVEQNGEVVAVVPLVARVSAVGPVVVLRRPVERGAILGADDLEIEQRLLAGSSEGALREVADAVGKQARVSIGGGRPLTLQMLSSPPVVRRGDAVRLVIETPEMRLSVPGEALESGGAGERVRVINPTSKRELAGQVIANGVVSVSR
jgi:flagella basal body P-ring formation protein FlgA